MAIVGEEPVPWQPGWRYGDCFGPGLQTGRHHPVEWQDHDQRAQGQDDIEQNGLNTFCACHVLTSPLLEVFVAYVLEDGNNEDNGEEDNPGRSCHPVVKLNIELIEEIVDNGHG